MMKFLRSILILFLLFLLSGCWKGVLNTDTTPPEDDSTNPSEERNIPGLEDTTVQISIHDASISEGHESTSVVEVTVELSLAATETVSVRWSTEDDTATANEDYIEASGELTFNPGDKSQVIQITVRGDMQFADDEDDEQFRLILTNPVNADIMDSESIIAIVNDDVTMAESYFDLHADLSEKIGYLHETLSDYDTEFTSEIIDIDLDDDGDMDIILLSSTVFLDPEGSHQEIIIYRNLQGAGFTEEVQSITGYARDIAVQDFNGDGRTDIFFADHGLDIPPFPGGQDKLFFQDNSGHLIDVTETTWPHQQLFSHSTCAGDVDSDGDYDIHVTLGAGQVLYINDGAGTFSYEGETRLPLQQISAYSYHTTSQNYLQSLWDLSFFWCEMADINLDGAIDIILGDHNIPTSTDSNGNIIGNSHLLLLNDGTGKFQYSFPESLIPNVVVEDFDPNAFSNATVEMKSFNANLDQCPDLASVSTDYAGKQVVAFFVNDCSGILSLSDDHQLTNVEWTDIMFVIDVNGDQLDDIVTAYISNTNHTRSTAISGGRAYINNGDGTFEQKDLEPDYLYMGGPRFYLALRAAGVVP